MRVPGGARAIYRVREFRGVRPQRVRTPGGASGDDWTAGGIGVAWAVSGGVPGITTTRVPTWTRP